MLIDEYGDDVSKRLRSYHSGGILLFSSSLVVCLLLSAQFCSTRCCVFLNEFESYCEQEEDEQIRRTTHYALKFYRAGNQYRSFPKIIGGIGRYCVKRIKAIATLDHEHLN